MTNAPCRRCRLTPAPFEFFGGAGCAHGSSLGNQLTTPPRLQHLAASLVAKLQLWPPGSQSRATRSPQSVSAGKDSTAAPAASAWANNSTSMPLQDTWRPTADSTRLLAGARAFPPRMLLGAPARWWADPCSACRFNRAGRYRRRVPCPPRAKRPFHRRPDWREWTSLSVRVSTKACPSVGSWAGPLGAPCQACCPAR